MKPKPAKLMMSWDADGRGVGVLSDPQMRWIVAKDMDLPGRKTMPIATIMTAG
jgi:hypothetical protein